MKDFLLFLWELPQNILGMILIIITRASRVEGEVYYLTKHKMKFQVSLGRFIIFGNESVERLREFTIKHEMGHQLQSKDLGWFYLILIGIPSLIFNVYDRLFHKEWNISERFDWYYNLPWEKDANIRMKIN